MRYKKGKLEISFDVINHLFMILFAVSILIPFMNLLTVSLSSPDAVNRYGLNLIPKTITFASYQKVFENNMIWIGYQNTLFRVVLGTILNVVFTCFAAYPLSKRYLPGRNYFTMFMIFNMFFSGGLIPTYLLIKNLHLMNSLWVLILPTLVSSGTMVIVRNYFMSIPESLEESAKLDGANDIRILFSVIMPISMPIIATIGLWYSVSHWNAYFDCLIYITQSRKMVLQLILRNIIIEGNSQYAGSDLQDLAGMTQASPESIKAATIYVATLPILCVYPFIQKYFVKGIIVGSLKG